MIKKKHTSYTVGLNLRIKLHCTSPRYKHYLLFIGIIAQSQHINSCCYNVNRLTRCSLRTWWRGKWQICLHLTEKENAVKLHLALKLSHYITLQRCYMHAKWEFLIESHVYKIRVTEQRQYNTFHYIVWQLAGKTLKRKVSYKLIVYKDNILSLTHNKYNKHVLLCLI